MTPSGPGGVPEGIRVSPGTPLDLLAQYYRMGPYAALPSGTRAQPGRPRLTDPAEIVQQLIERGIVPAVREQRRTTDRWLCIFTDDDTGEVLARLTESTESPEGTYSIVRAQRARRAAAARLPFYLAGEDISTRHITLRCRRIRGSEFTY